jgi:hypothetical protein
LTRSSTRTSQHPSDQGRTAMRSKKMELPVSP